MFTGLYFLNKHYLRNPSLVNYCGLRTFLVSFFHHRKQQVEIENFLKLWKLRVTYGNKLDDGCENYKQRIT